MLVTQQKILRRFWYPIVPSDRLTDAPFPFTLLGANIVLFRDAAGHASALIDRCAHRTAALSQGWLDAGDIVCPYHGWAYAVDGKCPAHSATAQMAAPAKVSPSRRSRVQRTLRHVWVALDEPLSPIPDWPEERIPATAASTSSTSRGRAGLEADGEQLRQRPHPLRASQHVRRHQRSRSARATIERLATASSPAPTCRSSTRPAEAEPARRPAFTIRHMTAHWYLPFLRRLHIRYPQRARPHHHHGGDTGRATGLRRSSSSASATTPRPKRRPPASSPSTAASRPSTRRCWRHRLRRAARHSFRRRAPYAVRPAGPSMRRMLLDLFAPHGETEQTRHVPPRRAAE